jgi:hypothetical protein
MRRWLTLLLLFVLPAQFSWAAAAAYCQHEPATAAVSHIGHHSHVHKAGKTDKTEKSGVAKLAADNDCGYCHLSFAKPLPPLALQFGADARVTRDAAATPAFRSRGPDHPERPNWRIA